MTATFTEQAVYALPDKLSAAGLTDAEATSPARRSPQVRAAQRLGSRRPDLLPKQPADLT